LVILNDDGSNRVSGDPRRGLEVRSAHSLGAIPSASVPLPTAVVDDHDTSRRAT